MPHRDPRTNLKDPDRLSRRLMELVGAALRKSPPTDMISACRIMRDERDAWMKPAIGEDRYAKARDALAAGKINEKVVLIEMVSNCVTRILANETRLAAKRDKAAAKEALAKFRAGGEVVPFDATQPNPPAPES
jgi:hypothetical protein